MWPFGILVVDDYEPFCRTVRSMLQRADFQVIGQASDGLEAVQKAEELQPDLILLDIGLPKLNGIEAAKRIRKVAPHSRILFLSQESSPDVVQEALNLGALGYLHKPRTQRELLPAIESVLAGRQFVSSDLKGYELRESPNAQAPHRHEILFFSDDAVLLEGFTRFIAAALKAGNPAMVLATEPHEESLLQRLKKEGVAIDAAIQQGTYLWLDATQTPDPVRFLDAVRKLIEATSKAGRAGHPRLALCGERAGRLWAEGETDAALQLEQLCNDLARTHEVDILCAYPFGSLHAEEAEQALKRIYAEHSAVHSR